MQNPAAVSDTNGEWIELFNSGSQSVNLNGWVLRDAGSNSHTINQDVFISPGSYVVLGRNDNSNQNGGIGVAYEYSSFTLGNGSDEVILEDDTGNVIDEVFYDGGSQWPDPTGASMELSSIAADNNDGSNWAEATDALPSGDQGTPGTGPDQGVNAGSIVITEIMQNPSAVSDGSGEWFEVHNTGGQAVNLNGWIIRDDGSDSHTVANDVIIQPGAYVVLGRNANINTNGGISVAYQYSGITLSNGADEVVLEAPDGSIADTVAYTGSAPWVDPTGASMELTDPATDNSAPANWVEATSTLPSGDFGSPGSATGTSSGGGGSTGGGSTGGGTATSIYTPFFGNTHAHSEYSDGNRGNDPSFLDAASGFRYARDIGGLDWLIMSEHNHATAGMDIANYQLAVGEAATVNAESPNFTALLGMEWGTISTGGHVITVSDNLWGWEPGNFDIFVDRGDYNGAFNQANTEGTFIELAHPSTSHFDNIFNLPYNSVWDQAISLVAIKSGPAFAEATDFSNPSSSTFQTRYRDLLLKGYHVGPTGDQDTHFTNWGLANEQRTAVLATSNSRTAILDALKAGRTYAIEDRNIVVTYSATFGSGNFEIADTITAQQGSTITFNVSVSDPDGEATQQIELRNGTIGGSSVSTITSSSSETLSFNVTANGSGTEFYYLRITQADGQRVWTAPIWVNAQ
jgi:hypothetical protein